MAAAQIQRISHVHDQIMNWMVTNPHLNLGECARQFGVTQVWLSTIIHSDVFQAKLKERQDEIFGECALEVKDRIVGLANSVLSRIQERVDHCPEGIETKVMVDCADKMLEKMGYGGASNKAAVQINQQFVIRAPVEVVDAKDWARQAGAVVEERGPPAKVVQMQPAVDRRAGETNKGLGETNRLAGETNKDDPWA